jgi:Bacterial alpha-L-rhamnosidase C-terminal domain
MAMYYGGVNSSYANKISDFLTTAWTPIGAEPGELPGSIVMYVEGFEVKGHLKIGQAKRALDLIRLSWGWNLRNPFGTESTFVEGYEVDGSWRYRDDSYSMNGTYTAHSLAWSTGPSDALVSYIVGLQPTSPGGATWSLQPQYGDLTFAEGGFTLPTGKFSSGWKIQGNRTDIVVDTPTNTSGTVALPLMNGTTPQRVMLDSRELPVDATRNGSQSTIQCGGGKHHLVLEY